MSPARAQGGWLIAATIVVALMLAILPLPTWAEAYRPAWVIIALIYWSMQEPQRVGVGVAWTVGLLLDVMQGSLLGQHAFAAAVVAYLTLGLHQRLRVFPLLQQALTVLMFTALYQLILLWFNGIIGKGPVGWQYWMPSLMSLILWPWVFVFMRDLRRRSRSP